MTTALGDVRNLSTGFPKSVRRLPDQANTKKTKLLEELRNRKLIA